jgi:alpha-tubulin suppressor-like RCC1 family protein
VLGLSACEGDPTPPDPVTGLGASAVGTTVTLAWTNPSTYIVRVVVRRAAGTTPPADPDSGDDLGDVGLDESFIDTGLSPGTTYSYSVFTDQGTLYNNYSVAASATVTIGTVPDAPTIGTAVAGNAEVTLSWTAPGFDGGSAITGYTVTPYIAAVAQTPQTFNSTLTTQTVTGLTNGVTYTFTVAAINSVGTGPESGMSDPATPATVPDAPTIGTAVAGSAEVTLSWTAPGFDGGSAITGYTVTPYIAAVAQTPQTFNSTLTTQTVTGLTNGVTYTFTVAAINSVGTGPESGMSDPATPAAPVIAFSAGPVHSCALLDTGIIRCWGANESGELGNGTTTDSSSPVTVTGITTATGITTGSNHSCAVLGDGTVRCWGRNNQGQLGNGTTTNSSTPVTVTGISTAVAVDAGGDHTCALLGDGTVKCWGRNNQGQLGNGTTTNSSTPVTVTGISTATDVSGSAMHTCALLGDGTIKCWGRNNQGQLGNGTTTNSSIPVTVTGISTATDVDANGNNACAVLGDGTAKCWGANPSGQLGNGSTVAFSSTPVSVTGISTATAITFGGAHACARLTDGTLKCWGLNTFGQLGDGTTTGSSTPVSVTGISTATGITASEGGGTDHTCAVLAGGTVKCWGYNGGGQLGDGTTTDSSVPVTVIGL